MKRICFCCTIPGTFTFSTEVFRYLQERGNQIILISSEKEKLKALAKSLGVKYYYVPFRRSISPLADLACIWKLIKYFRNTSPDIVVGATPKAAMVSMIAARMADIKHRIYHVYGLPFETAKGFRRKLLSGIERFTGYCATKVVPIGTSVKERLLSLGIIPQYKMVQPGLLTVGGVDPQRFSPDRFIPLRNETRTYIGIPENCKVIGFVGRLTEDKGLTDIISIWDKIKRRDDVCLLIIGDMDERVPIPKETCDSFFAEDRVFHIGFTDEIEKYFAVMDIFLFPSYREGFGNVNIEAQAMKIPVITYEVTGCRDAVEDNVTGYCIPFKNHDAMCARLDMLLDTPDLRDKLGFAGRQRVLAFFTRSRVSSDFIRFLTDLQNV